MNRRKLKMGEEGQAMVETALAFPILLALMTLVMQFALIYNASNVTRYAAFCAARCAATFVPIKGETDVGSAETDMRMAAASALAPVCPFIGGGSSTSKISGYLQRLVFANIDLAIMGIDYSNSASFRSDIYVQVHYAYPMPIPVANTIIAESMRWVEPTGYIKAQIVARLAGSGYKGAYMNAGAANINEGWDRSFEDPGN